MERIVVTCCCTCPFCTEGEKGLFCGAAAELLKRYESIDKDLFEDDRLECCPISEGVLVIAGDINEDEVSEENM